MFIDIELLNAIAKIITSLGVIGATVIGVVKWYLKPKKLAEELESLKEENEKKIEELRDEHVRDIKKIEEEACLHTYGILACLKGLQEKGCNGPVTEAIDKFEKYINKRAHDQEE